MTVVRRVGAAATMLVLLPAGAAGAQAPPPVGAPPLAAPVIAAPVSGPQDGAPAPSPLPPSPVAAPAPTAAMARSCPGARKRSGIRRREAAVRCLVDQARVRAGMRGFRRSAVLERAARGHARDMVRLRYFAHQRAGGPALESRAKAAGWRGRALGEAIAYGCGTVSTPLSIVRSWLASPPHAAILLAGDLGKVGVAVARRAPVACGGGATYVLDAGRS